jgi:serine phosphatase RsbU (regulator of sigma subunit)
VSGPLIRRLRLPPAPTSPAAARSAVDALLREARLDRLRDEALLLTSELVTNAVIHAGTDIEVEITASTDGLRVVVADFGAPELTAAVTGITTMPGQPATAGELKRSASRDGWDNPHRRFVDGAQPGEGGRGLLLVSRFASRWGTSHEPGGRAVWFQLDGPPSAQPPGRSRAGGPAAAAPGEFTIDEVLATIAGTGGPPGGSTPGRLPESSLADLVERLARGLGAATATLTVDRGDGRDAQVIARFAAGDPVAPDARTIRAPLPLARPWTGEFTATGARGRHAEAVAAITARQLALIIENQRLQDAHNDGRGWLLFLAEAGQLLAQSMNVDLTVVLIPRLVVPRLGLWCAVHLTNEYGELGRAALTHADESVISTLAADLDAHLPRLEWVMAGDGAAPLGPPMEGISLPLRVRSERIGTFTVGRPAGRAHGADELAIIEDLAQRAALAIENARVHESRSHVASALQRPLLPPTLPSIDGLETAAQYVPAGNGLDVGGDFYDIVALSRSGSGSTSYPPPEGWMLVVGDVSGKGVGAAAVTGLVRDVLHTLAGDHREAEHTLRRLNATLVERGGGHFCTLALAFLTTVADGVFDLSVHLAGHEQPVLLRADGTTALIGENGTALGLIDAVRAPRTTVRLFSGDAVVFYTDGVTERRRGSVLYGQGRLQAELSRLAGLPAAVLTSRLRASVLGFSPQQPRDDIAIVALRAM